MGESEGTLKPSNALADLCRGGPKEERGGDDVVPEVLAADPSALADERLAHVANDPAMITVRSPLHM